ncbi:hypothetical protein EKE94_06115 [Mesobaculum littorinae]|uniref:Uncharacterized protein n=1 Tax=Mesobaculum littorinae TaxID=2486419 RepID=A0A438AIB6_9RHOB|nr:hypothetical protein [Mesobaculum littorinae]RVV98491.1 hypothetical protein EKE94_06115 [Mesobaculum littorinae]
MPDDTQRQTFEERKARIAARHARLARGSTARVLPDGRIEARAQRRRFAFPWTGLAAALACALIVKTVFLAHFGAEDYAGRVDRLWQGSALDRAGAWVLTPDDLTLTAAAHLEPMLP